jgi:DNA-directed RNA polymerase specialized sigma subunit
MKPEQQKLIDEHKRLLENEARKYSAFVPYTVVLAEAYKIANKAAQSYDPKKGTKFSTHLYNQLQKLQRISTKYGPTARLSEKKQFTVQKINQAEEVLHNEFGRQPTAFELGQYTGIHHGTVAKLLKQRKKEIAIGNLTHQPIFIEDMNDDWVHFVYHDLPDRDKFIFEHKTGFGGKPEMSTEDISKKLGISPSTVNNRVKFITDRLAEGWQEHGS